MMFYVEARIHFMQYQAPDGTIEHRGLIEADSLDQATAKFKEYWDTKDAMRIYYTILECSINQVID